MSDDQHEDRIAELFAQAKDLSAEDQTRFLDEACRDDSAEVRRLVDKLLAANRQRDNPSENDSTVSGRPKSTVAGSGNLEIRCPNCHVPMEVAVDTPLTDLTCSSCGSHFSLVDQSQATRIAPPLTRLGRFELIERIGIGGFGSVWKARDKELDRTVAIKIPRAGGMSAEEQEKFFREARAAAQLKHPNIVSVHEVGRDGDSIYIVSDFVRGVTLGDWLTGQKLTSREAAQLCAKIADALHHAHEQGVVHRDLKPANIMMDYNGQPHIMDFGLARRETGEITMTMDGHVLGTPAYMSPEQAEGKAHTADRRSDVYSLGVILFQLLTGELPFRGNARMLIKQVIHDEPPSPRELNANVPQDLETIVLKCLEKQPAKRNGTALQLAEDLRRFLNLEPIVARPISPVERTWRWILRNPALATVIALTTAIAVLSPLLILHERSQRRIADEFRSYMLHADATGDFNRDGRLDFEDIEGFTEKLKNKDFEPPKGQFEPSFPFNFLDAIAAVALGFVLLGTTSYILAIARKSADGELRGGDLLKTVAIVVTAPLVWFLGASLLSKPYFIAAMSTVSLWGLATFIRCNQRTFSASAFVTGRPGSTTPQT